MDFNQTFSEPIAQVYYQQSLAGSDMYKVAELIEPLKVKCKEEKDVLILWDFMDDAVAVSFGKTWLNSILELRKKFSEAILNDFEETINEGFKQSEEAAWNILRIQYFSAFKEWRTPFALLFLRNVSGKFTVRKKDVLDLEHSTVLMIERRYVETYDFVIKNAKDDSLGKNIQAHLWAVAAAIQLYYVGNKTQTNLDINQGLSFSKDEPYLKDMAASLELENNQIESARKQYEEMIREIPNNVEGYNGLGNCFKKENQISPAEELYNKAIAIAPRKLGAYQNKISLYCSNAKTYSEKNNLIKHNVDIMEIIEPESCYDIYTDTGYACQLANDYLKAEEWFQKAITQNRERVEGYSVLGHLYIQQLPKEESELQTSEYLTKAETAFKKAIELGKTCFDGYWGLNVLYQKLSKNDEAIHWLEESYPLCPMFNELCNIELGNLYVKKENLEVASEKFLAALQIHPESKDATEHAKGFAERLSIHDAGKGLGTQGTESIYQKILEIKGKEWKQTYFELLTNSIKAFGNQENKLIELYTAAHNEFPENSSFSTYLNELLFYKTFGKSIATLVTNPEPITIECNNKICEAFLQPDKNELRPEFMEKIRLFRVDFKNRFGVTLPPLKFRQFEWVNVDYNFYTMFDEVSTSIGATIRLDKNLAIADQTVLSKLNIQAEPVNLYSPFINMCWIDPEQSEIALNANVELKDPLDLIFIHLLIQAWSQMKRFCNFDDPEISSVTGNEDINTTTGFMQVMHALLDLRAPIIDKDFILEEYKDGISDEKNIQQIARELIKSTTLTPVYPSAQPKFKYYKTDESIEMLIRSSYDQTKNGQWAAQILPSDCQDILAAIRNLSNPHGRCIVSDDRMAYTFWSIAQLEFPFFEFKTKADLVSEKIDIDDNMIELIRIS